MTKKNRHYPPKPWGQRFLKWLKDAPPTRAGYIPVVVAGVLIGSLGIWPWLLYVVLTSMPLGIQVQIAGRLGLSVQQVLNVLTALSGAGFMVTIAVWMAANRLAARYRWR